ncbi:hypothetical protein [Fibrobacter sp.]|uniref:hypothetical protein n=1 Tax=Fibrobacter sp. TaxID=35828 RepID=UPI00262BA03F|nr:hypothetical protein [Fibrobacter sp.]MDD5943028.1 hypothetical protein [Fibrobacter sp.]
MKKSTPKSHRRGQANEVLSRKKFHFPTETVGFLISRLKSIGVNLAAVETLVGDFPDPKDVVFFEVAMEKNKTDETFLVTGNQKHFPQHPKVVYNGAVAVRKFFTICEKK